MSNVDHIPNFVTVDRLPVASAVRSGTGTNPVEYIAIVDCGEGTPTHRYATFHLYVWADQVKARDGDHNLTWPQARRSLAERAGLIPVPRAEAVVLAQEPHAADDITVYLDGQPADARQPAVAVTTHVVRIDRDDEEDWWMAAALARIAHLSPAAQQHITTTISQLAAERRVDLDQLRVQYEKEFGQS